MNKIEDWDKFRVNKKKPGVIDLVKVYLYLVEYEDWEIVGIDYLKRIQTISPITESQTAAVAIALAMGMKDIEKY